MISSVSHQQVQSPNLRPDGTSSLYTSNFLMLTVMFSETCFSEKRAPRPQNSVGITAIQLETREKDISVYGDCAGFVVKVPYAARFSTNERPPRCALHCKVAITPYPKPLSSERRGCFAKRSNPQSKDLYSSRTRLSPSPTKRLAPQDQCRLGARVPLCQSIRKVKTNKNTNPSAAPPRKYQSA